MFAYIVSTCTLPVGSYYGNIRVPMLAKQEVYVNFHKRLKGEIHLKGPVTKSDTFYYIKNLESVVLGDDIIEVLKKYKCSIINIGYNVEDDTANVHLKIPILGKTFLKMHKVKTF